MGLRSESRGIARQLRRRGRPEARRGRTGRPLAACGLVGRRIGALSDAYVRVGAPGERGMPWLAEGGCGSVGLRPRRADGRTVTPGEERVQLRDDCSPLADGRTHSLYRAATHVANGEDPFDPGL